jgi:uncharacterized membrane protein YhaH (DUF805 family)
VSQQRENTKLFFGIFLLVVTPVFLFVKPTTGWAVLRDIALLLSWAFIFWLLITGKRESNQTDSKQPRTLP